MLPEGFSKKPDMTGFANCYQAGYWTLNATMNTIGWQRAIFSLFGNLPGKIMHPDTQEQEKSWLARNFLFHHELDIQSFSVIGGQIPHSLALLI